MGSALCFPVESLVFWALSVAAISVYESIPPSQVARFVYVFGDDLIVPAGRYAELVMRVLPKFELAFNEGKCCTSGFFRESCGMDAFKGVEVTPVKARKPPVFSHTAPVNLVSWASYQRALFLRGFRRTSHYIVECLLKLRGISCFDMRDPFSQGEHSNAVYVDDEYPVDYKRNVRVRFNRKLHRLEIYVLQLKSREYRALEDGWSAVLRYGSAGRERPGVYAFPRRVRAIRGWVDLQQ
jgi:hypothetical protein